jgi:AraC-like DNA-binding protein
MNPDPATLHQQAVDRAIAAATADLTIDVDTMARAALYSRYHFSRIFTAKTGMPPRRYLKQLRMAEAQRLLAQTSKTVADVAVAVGYGSVGTFGCEFKAWCGWSPMAYRRLAHMGEAATAC